MNSSSARTAGGGLARTYEIDRTVDGIDHGLAYRALREGALDVTDAYSTDAELMRHDLVVLLDDLSYFPRYDAAPLVRVDVGEDVIGLLNALGGTLNEQRMQALNASVKFDGLTFAEAAGHFSGRARHRHPGRRRGILDRAGGKHGAASEDHGSGTRCCRAGRRGRRSCCIPPWRGVSRRHLFLRPAPDHSRHRPAGADDPGIRDWGAARHSRAVPVFAVAHTAQHDYRADDGRPDASPGGAWPWGCRSANACGTSTYRCRCPTFWRASGPPPSSASVRRRWRPSSARAGLAIRIVTGLALNDMSLVLEGAVPAAALALITELLFEGLERLVVPGHLRVSLN